MKLWLFWLVSPALGDRHIASGDADIPRHGRQERDGPAGLDGIVDRVQGDAAVDRGRFGSSHTAGPPCRMSAAGTLVIVSPHSGVYPLTCSLQPVESDGPIPDEFSVIQPFADDDMEHRQGKRRIGSRPQLEPDIGLGGRLGQIGIHDDQARPPLPSHP